MDLAKIPAQPKTGVLNVLIEIPAGSKNKYEFDKELAALTPIGMWNSKSFPPRKW